MVATVRVAQEADSEAILALFKAFATSFVVEENAFRGSFFGDTCLTDKFQDSQNEYRFSYGQPISVQ